MISDQQVEFFRTFGFLPLREAFSREEMAAIGKTFDDMLESDREGQPFPGEQRQALYGIAERNPLLTELVEDDRIYETAGRLLGPGFHWLCSEGNLYVGETEWHPDGSRLNYPPMKVSLYLDALTKSTGCLRVIPGSHRLPFHEALRPMEKMGVPGAEVPCYFLESSPGDVLFLNMNIWHAAYGGAAGRRHLAVNFVPEATEPEHVEILKRNHRVLIDLMARFQYSQPGRAFTDDFLNSEKPRIRRMAAKWVELGLQ